MSYAYIPIIILGILTLGWGFFAANEWRRPWDIIGAFLAPVGLLLALLGTLLLCVPDFFKS